MISTIQMVLSTRLGQEKLTIPIGKKLTMPIGRKWKKKVDKKLQTTDRQRRASRAFMLHDVNATPPYVIVEARSYTATLAADDLVRYN